MKNILITGGAGFIGSSLYKKLDHNRFEITILDNFSDFYDIKQKLYNLSLSKRIEKNKKYKNIFNIDIRDKKIVEFFFSEKNIDLIIHFAALPGVHQSNLKMRDYFDNNVIGSFNIFECARKFNVKKIIFISSSSVYGNNKKIPFKESFLPSPISFYGVTKVEGENLAKFFSKNFGLDVLVLRLFTFYGPSQRPDLMLHKFFLNHFTGKQSVVFSQTERDFTYIDDGVEMITRSIEYVENLKGFDILNIGASKPVKIEEVLRIIKKLIPKFNYVEEKRKSFDMKRTYADMGKSKRILNYEPKIGIEEGIERFYSWFKEYYKV
ncbi:MAG: NAD-dependent epimerase/dehydratase family protein [candidate division WOR-3 bacterium]